MNSIDILIEGYAEITDNGWNASGTTTLITATPVIANPLPNGEGVKQSHKNVIPGLTRNPEKPGSPIKVGDDKDKVIRIIVDPGANRDLLLQQLNARRLTLNAIDIVFITHHHLDHAMNVGLFPNAQVVDEEAVYTQAKAIEGVDMLPGTDITVMKTPGHEYAHGALVVPTEEGTVVVAGDNFWWTTTEEQIVDVTKHDDFAEKMEELIESRKKVLDIADWIIPGHGKMFQVNK